jgi:transposase
MDEREFRVLIKHYFMNGKSSHETEEKLDKHYAESAHSIRTVYKWFQNVRCGHMSMSDDESSGRPVEATTPETGAALDQVYKLKADYNEK